MVYWNKLLKCPRRFQLFGGARWTGGRPFGGDGGVPAGEEEERPTVWGELAPPPPSMVDRQCSRYRNIQNDYVIYKTAISCKQFSLILKALLYQPKRYKDQELVTCLSTALFVYVSPEVKQLTSAHITV